MFDLPESMLNKVKKALRSNLAPLHNLECLGTAEISRRVPTGAAYDLDPSPMFSASFRCFGGAILRSRALAVGTAGSFVVLDIRPSKKLPKRCRTSGPTNEHAVLRHAPVVSIASNDVIMAYLHVPLANQQERYVPTKIECIQPNTCKI